MALKEDYKDAVFAGLRKYKMLDNGDGTVSPVDMTEYEAAGDKFGAKDVNAITKMVNCTGDAFDPGRDYEVGDYTIYDNTVWKFTTAHPAGEWDESHVEKTRILVEIAEQNKNFVKLDEKIESTDITQERLVGKFNGKNVYEKVIDRHINIPTSTNFQIFNIPHGIENFESGISINIMADGYTLPFFRDDGYLTTYIYIVDNTNIVLYNRINWSNNFRITLRYTKSE